MTRPFDLVIRGGTVVTASDSVRCDVGIRDGRIAALADELARGADEIDATGKLVLPGGVDGHCHIAQLSSLGLMSADDFESGTIAAAFGGTTTIIPFAAQHRGQSLRQVVQEYHERARPHAVIDYGYHLIVSDPTEQVLGQELPALIRDGFTSFKVYMTYERLRLSDHQMLEVLALARREGALVMVHAENEDMIRWLSERLVEGGRRAPKYHAVSHARLAESEATHRAVALAQLVDVPILIVHVSAAEAMAEIRRAQDQGLRIYAETCPQYLFLTAADLDRAGHGGRQVLLQPAAARRAGAGGAMDRPAQRHLPGLLLRPRALPLRRDRQAERRRQGVVQEDPERRPRHRAAPAPAVLRRREQGSHRHPPVRGADRHQRRQALRAASAQGHDRRRRRCRPRDLGPAQAGHRQLRHAAREDRLHALRGPAAHRLAGDRAQPRAGGRPGRRAPRAARQRPVPPRGLSDYARPLGRLEPEVDPQRNFGATILP